jgi:RNA polymerase sigma-70 factor (ECF subfamily)
VTEGRGANTPPQETAYEKRLIARLQAGDQEALGILFEMHVERIFAFARHLLGSREDAEEITSEAFLRAFERVASFRGECPFRGWLFGITRNLCLDRLRQPRLLLLEPEFADAQTDEGRQAAQLDTSLVVRRALEELEEDYRVVLTLCDVEEWDAREVAVVLEKSLPATKSLLYRARRALRARLTELWEDAEDITERERGRGGANDAM